MISYFGATTKGNIREKNEDAYLIWSADGAYPYLFAVADGVGGSNAGEIASKTACDILFDKLSSKKDFTEDKEYVDRFFSELSEEINKGLAKISYNDKEKSGLGTTMSILLVFNDKAFIAHIGDSSIYKLNKVVTKLTDDHTFVNELLKKNEITESEAKNHPQRNMITKAFGCGFDYSMDVEELEIEKGDIFILCTDGLFSNDEKEEDILDPEFMHEKSVEDLTDHLIRFADDSGGKDNTTVITVKI